MNDAEHELALDQAMEKLKEVFDPAFRAYMQAIPTPDSDDEPAPAPDTNGGTDPQPDPDPAPAPDPSSGFKVFDLLRYKNRPSSAAMGMHPLKIWYESAFYPGGTHDELPKKDDVQKLARQSPALSIVDIEHWLPNSNWRLTDESAGKYAQVMKWYKEALPSGSKSGYYGVVPGRNYWDAVRGEDSDKYRNWAANNDLGKAIAPYLDVTFPSVYTFYEDRKGWATYAKANVAEAKRVCPGKPCYPVMWPEYHVSNKDRRGQPIEADYFRFQLDTLREVADGCVIWTISRVKTVDFKDIPAWYGETKEFIKSL